MSTEFRAIRKKRTSPDAASPSTAPEGDHRKRRRNRTTQSCLNCHASKRMCDRKRPCGRCTQLGLTGLCVYEVDDPNQRSDAPDESSRLRMRVAELEGVIRELKNKPHPRWVKSGSTPSEEFERCHARSRSQSASEESTVESHQQSGPSHPLTSSNASSKEILPEKQASYLVDAALQREHLSSFISPPPTGCSVPLPTLLYSTHLDSHSPSSAPSTGIVTPTEERPQMQIMVAGADQHSSNDVDLTTLFMSYPELLACDDSPGHVDHVHRTSTNSQYIHPLKYHHGHFMEHCGCLNEAASYNVVLELSLRLRRAADILSRSASHHFNNGCPLNQKIVDLDVFATTTLGNMATSPIDVGVHLCPQANSGLAGAIPPTFASSTCIPAICAPAISPSSLRTFGPWSGICTADPSAPCDESFMAWEPGSRRI